MEDIFCQIVKKYTKTSRVVFRSFLPYLVMIPTLDIFRLASMVTTLVSGQTAIITGIAALGILIVISILCALDNRNGHKAALILFDLYGSFSVASVILHFASIKALPSFLIIYRFSGSLISLFVIIFLTQKDKNSLFAKL